MLFFAILVPLALFIIEACTEHHTVKLVLQIINTLILLAAGAVSTFVVFLLSLLASRGGTSGVLLSLGFTGVCVLFFVFLIGIVWHKYNNKKFMLSIGIPLLLCLLLGIGSVATDSYIRSIPKVTVDENLTRYRPSYVDNILVRLDETTTLWFYDRDKCPVMDGATALYPVYAAFANAVYPPSVFTNSYWDGPLRCTKTDGAYESLINGEADIIFVASPSAKQAEAAKKQGVELVFTPIGRESFVFFVNSKNRLDNITVEQIQQIYSGQITQWKELGVRSLGDIRPFQREEGSGSQTYMVRLMGDIPFKEPEMEEIVDAMSGVITRVADYKNYKNAIGYSFRFYASDMAANNKIKLLSLNGIAPTKENIINNTYPLSGEFYAVTRSDCTEETTMLIDWILSEQGQEIIDKTGYVRLY